MSYASITDLAERVSWENLAEAAAPDAPGVTGETLRGYLADATVPAGATATDYERAAARVTRALLDASAEVEGYLAEVGVPADTPNVVRTRALDVAAYRLLGGATESDRYQVWRRAIEWLESVARRQITAPWDTPVAAGGTNASVRYTSRRSRWASPGGLVVNGPAPGGSCDSCS